MEKSSFEIPLRLELEGVLTFKYEFDDAFFAGIEGSEISKGKLTAEVEMQKTGGCFQLKFFIKGFVSTVCDRCLDEMRQKIEHHDMLMIRFGAEFSQEDENITVPEKEKSLDISWYLYEFVMLGIPMVNTHVAGECNPDMLGKLQKYLVEGDTKMLRANEQDKNTDPRWAKLKEIIINDTKK